MALDTAALAAWADAAATAPIQATSVGNSNCLVACQAAVDAVHTAGGGRARLTGTHTHTGGLRRLGSIGGAYDFVLDMTGATITNTGTAVNMLINSGVGESFPGYTGRGRLLIMGGVLDHNGFNGATGTQTGTNDILAIGHADTVVVQDVIFRNTNGGHALEFNSSRNVWGRRNRFEGFVNATGNAGRNTSEAIQMDSATSGGYVVLPKDSTATIDWRIDSSVFTTSARCGLFATAIGSHAVGKTPYTGGQVFGNSGEVSDLASAIHAFHWDGAVIQGNDFSGGLYGALLLESQDAIVQSNTFEDATVAEVSINSNSTDVLVADNTLRSIYSDVYGVVQDSNSYRLTVRGTIGTLPDSLYGVDGGGSGGGGGTGGTGSDPVLMPLEPEDISFESPFEVAVYDKSHKWLGGVGSYDSFSATVNHNADGVANFMVPATHARTKDLCAEGARAIISYNGQFLMSGDINSWSQQGVASQQGFSYTFISDFAKLRQMLGWPDPGMGIDKQGIATMYYTVSGPAETVLKQLVRVNAQRLGIPITIAPDLSRGKDVTVSLRMNSLADKLFPIIDQAGIGVDFRQLPTGGWWLDVYVPTVRTRVLSVESGVVADINASKTAPTLTRVVVGGQGEGTAREFLLVVDDALEARYGTPDKPFIREGFVDARDLSKTEDLEARGREALLEAAEIYGFGIKLTETSTFRYPTTLRVGDSSPIQLAPDQEPYVDVCRSVTIDHGSDGLSVEPTIGDPDAEKPTAIMMAAINRLAKQAKIKGTT